MTDLSDLRRRAAQHAGYGNEWARKAVGLVDRLEALNGTLAAFSLSDEGEFTWLMYEHTDGTPCAVTQVDCPAVLETLRALLPDTNPPTGAEGS